MKRVLQKLSALFILPLLLTFSLAPQAQAAEFHSGEAIRLTDTAKTLDNPYIFGGNIQIDTPVSNELTTAGGDIVVTSPIEGSALVAGGNITIRGAVGNNLRIAGGNITIDGPVARDLVIAGGSVSLTKNAKIGGDILFAGGQLKVDGPVAGKIQVNGGNIQINNTVGGDVSGEMEKLTLGSAAVINGNLSYKSPERAQIDQGAKVTGKTSYGQVEHRDKNKDQAREFVTAAAFYKLITDIILTVLFIYFFRRAIMGLIQRMREEPVKNGAIGFGYLVLVPIAALLVIVLLWLTGATFLFYFLTMLIATYVAKAFVGWMILNWMDRKDKKEYELDWKAGIVGPVVLLILSIIPIFGWLAEAIIFLIALGALIQGLLHLASNQRNYKAVPARAKK